MTLSPRQLRLPDLFAYCDLKDGTNPYYKEVSAESRVWINSYDVFTDRKRAFFVQGSNELLCSHVYHYAGYEQFRATCDFVNLLFVVDEVSDDQNGTDARATGDTFAKVMQDARWDDGSTLAKITREFRDRFMHLAGPKNVKRFVSLCKAYTDCVAIEAELRERGEVMNLESFVPLRRNNSAVLLCFSLVEHTLGVDLADQVYENEIFMEAYWAACDFVCCANDIYSYDMEQSKGHAGNNIVTVLMKQHEWKLQDTTDFIGAHCKSLVETYISAQERLPPSLGPDARRFIDALGAWMIGNLVWSFETVRYFGPHHLSVRKTGIVHLRPREPPEDSDSESESEE